MRMKHLETQALPLAAVAMLTTVAAYSQQSAAVSSKNVAANAAKENPGTAAAKMRRTSDGHPDLSGMWAYGIALPPSSLKKVVDGKATVSHLDQSARLRASNDVPGALPWTKAPSYKPELQEKVKSLAANESKVDAVFYCGKPGVPRIGSPRRIVQLPNEMIFLYEDVSGDPYRVIPTDGRPHRKDANPSYYGDSVGRWEGDTLVIESINFVDGTWFGEEGYFHSDKMRVVERLWLSPENNLVYQVTVDDPAVLTQPWTNYPRVNPPSNDLLEESPPCKDEDGPRLINSDHHVQR
jgi:hypothetical protein